MLGVEPRLGEGVSAWLAVLRESLRKGSAPGRVDQVGTILHVADGVATVAGLPEARFNELLRFPGGVRGLAFNLDPESIGCVVLGDDTSLSAGDTVRLTGQVAAVPVGDALLGRVVDALGRPLDGEGAIAAERELPVERESAPILERAPVVTQLITGTTAIDALIPIGRGQRELIVGDRATGKTALAVDAMISQRDTDIVCIYVAIGQKVSTVKRVTESLRKNGSLRRTIIVSADADDSPGLQYIAPYAATTMGEHFMEQGRDVLVVYDDLTRHARSYREMSLLLRRPPGREAYPGDIFFIHSRLLERATHLGEKAGGGSLTAIPIVETQAKNISAYIPTNLISITDGQIFLDPDLFYKGIKPAIHVGKSVSRVGGKTQLPAIRAAAKQLRLEYAQFAELEIFTRFGATVEKETQRKIERGRRIRELLKQSRLDPFRATDEVMLLLAVDRGFIDRVPVERVTAFVKALKARANPDIEAVSKKVESGGKLTDEEWDALAKVVESVTADFALEEAVASGADTTGETAEADASAEAGEPADVTEPVEPAESDEAERESDAEPPAA